MMDYIVILAALVIGYIIGAYREKRYHIKKFEQYGRHRR